jgi:hypothetical protein
VLKRCKIICVYRLYNDDEGIGLRLELELGLGLGLG